MSNNYDEEYLNFIKSLIKSFKSMNTKDVTIKSKEAGYYGRSSRKYLRKLKRDNFIESEHDYVNGSTIVNTWTYVGD